MPPLYLACPFFRLQLRWQHSFGGLNGEFAHIVAGSFIGNASNVNISNGLELDVT